MVRQAMRSSFSNFDWYYFKSGANSDIVHALSEVGLR